MKTRLLSFTVILLALSSLLSSCSTCLWATKDDNVVQPAAHTEVHHDLAVIAPSIPRQAPVPYFMKDAPAYESPSLILNGKNITVRTTAYCDAEEDHVKYGHLAAAGNCLKFGKVCSAAADWSRYPLGTKFRISSQPDVVYDVDDYGSALVGSGTIDLYRPTNAIMDAWGVREVSIEILQWGSFEDSLKMMRGRIHYPHVRRMVKDIQDRMDRAVVSSDVEAAPVTAMVDPLMVPSLPELRPSL